MCFMIGITIAIISFALFIPNISTEIKSIIEVTFSFPSTAICPKIYLYHEFSLQPLDGSVLLVSCLSILSPVYYSLC